MPLKWKGSWDTLDDFEQSLDGKSRSIYIAYKDLIIDLFTKLDKDGLLIRNFRKADIERLIKINEISDSAFLLNKNVRHFFLNLGNLKKNILMYLLKKFNFKTDKNSLAYQNLVILCHMYQVYTEDIKKYMIISINFNKIGINDPGKCWFGGLLNGLKRASYWNDFLQYLDNYNYIRNAVAHYSYYINGNELVFCEGPLGAEHKMSISEFINLTVDLNILANAFMLIFKDEFITVVG